MKSIASMDDATKWSRAVKVSQAEVRRD